jgi:hypothetical protein
MLKMSTKAKVYRLAGAAAAIAAIVSALGAGEKW